MIRTDTASDFLDVKSEKFFKHQQWQWHWLEAAARTSAPRGWIFWTDYLKSLKDVGLLRPRRERRAREIATMTISNLQNSINTSQALFQAPTIALAGCCSANISSSRMISLIWYWTLWIWRRSLCNSTLDASASSRRDPILGTNLVIIFKHQQ